MLSVGLSCFHYGSFNLPIFAPMTVENETLQHMMALPCYHENDQDYILEIFIV